MVTFKGVGLDYPIGMTAIIGPRGSAANILLAGLRKTVPCVRGFIFANMDELLNQQLQPDEAMDAFFHLLPQYQQELKERYPDTEQPFRHLVMSDFPQTDKQLKALLEFCPALRLAYVDSPCNDGDKVYGLAMEFRRDYKEHFIFVNASRKIQYQAECIVSGMDITAIEAKSMKAEIFGRERGGRKATDAWVYFNEIGQKPKPRPTCLAPPEPLPRGVTAPQQAQPTRAVA